MEANDGADCTVEPMTGTDHSVKDILIDVRYIISGLLDPDLMLDALCEFIEKKWQHAGARMHRKPNGHLELHIPKSFNENRPPVWFDAFDADKDTPLSSCFTRFPESDHHRNQLTFCENFMSMTPTAMKLLSLREPTSLNGKRCATPPLAPTRLSLDQLLQSGGPMLTVCLYRFAHSRETVVRVVFPHAVWDAGSVADFMRAWTSAVNDPKLGSVSEVLPLRHAPREMLSKVARESKHGRITQSQQAEKRQPASRKYPKNALAMFLLVGGILWRNFIVPLMLELKPRRLKPVQVWIPQNQLDAWRDEAMLERPANMSQDSAPFLSDNDLITSWAIYLLSQRRKSWLYGSFSIPLPVNMRAVDPQSRAALQIKPPTEAGSKASATGAAGKVLLHNWLSVITLSAKWLNVSRGGKWQIAWLLREKVNATLHTPSGVDEVSQILATANNVTFDESGTPSYGGGAETLVTPPSHEMVLASNWTQANFMAAANFKAAVIPDSDGAKKGDGLPSQVFGIGEPEFKRAQGQMFPQIIVFYKQPKEGILVTVNADEDLVNSGKLGHFVEA